MSVIVMWYCVGLELGNPPSAACQMIAGSCIISLQGQVSQISGLCTRNVCHIKTVYIGEFLPVGITQFGGTGTVITDN